MGFPIPSEEHGFSPLLAHSADVMETIGARLSGAISAGDTVAISGPLGAGKSVLCRAIIRAKLRAPDLAVPSPSYTLVNVYDIDGNEIWHVDLYRVSDVEELNELGLDDAPTAILLVEWPERWQALPARKAAIEIAPLADDSRMISLQVNGDGWEELSRVWSELE